MVWTIFSSQMMSLPSTKVFLCIFLNTGFPDRPSPSTESICLMQKCALLIARPWIQQFFWLVYFDSRSWLIFFWFVFGPHLWKCSPSSADSVVCWLEVEKRIDDKPEVALTFIDRKYESSVEYGRTSEGKLVLLVITAKLFGSCIFRRVLWNSFSRWLCYFIETKCFVRLEHRGDGKFFEVNLSSVLIPNYGTWVEWQVFTCLYLRKQKCYFVFIQITARFFACFLLGFS